MMMYNLYRDESEHKRSYLRGQKSKHGRCEQRAAIAAAGSSATAILPIAATGSAGGTG